MYRAWLSACYDGSIISMTMGINNKKHKSMARRSVIITLQDFDLLF